MVTGRSMTAETAVDRPSTAASTAVASARSASSYGEAEVGAHAEVGLVDL